MTNDSRLGVNPLSWVDSKMSSDDPSAPKPKAEPESTGVVSANNEIDLVRIFEPVNAATKEELMGEDKIKIKQSMETAQVVQHLKDMADSLEAGTLRAAGAEKAIVLSIPDTMDIEMKVRRKKGKASLSLELEWEDDGKKAESLKISGE